MRKFLGLLLCYLVCLCVQLQVQAQPYGNEWINYSKTYYKIQVGQEGLYRIPFSTLQAEGLGSNAGSGYKMFTRGQEVPIYVTTNGTFGTSDYIEFIGEINDGSQDASLYQNPSWQLNPHRSLFSDTSAYYLVWDNTGTPKRYINTNNDVSAPPVPAETFFVHTITSSYLEGHAAGKPFRVAGVNHRYPDFDDAEGFASLQFGNGTSSATPWFRDFTLSTPARYTGAGAPRAHLGTKLVGRNDEFDVLVDHIVEIMVNGTTYNIVTYNAHDQVLLSDSIFLATMAGNSTVIRASVPDTVDHTDINSVAYLRFSYPRRFDLDNANRFMFRLANSQQKYLEIENFNGGTSFVLYDMTNNLRIVPVFADGKYKVLLPAGANPALPRKIYLASTASPCAIGCTFPCVPAQCAAWTVGDLNARQFTNFGTAANQGDYIIVSNAKLRTGATDRVQQFANYRETAAGGSHNVVIADIEDLYDQFAYGIPTHPRAVRGLVDYAFNVWPADPEYLFLIGKSVRYSATRTFPAAHNANLVPSWGDPASDNMLGATSTDYYQRLAIGRLSALTPAHVKAYYDKIIEYELEEPCTLVDRAWTKRFAHVASGWTGSQTSEFQDLLNSHAAVCENTEFLGANVTNYSHTGTQTAPLPLNSDFTNAYNAGYAMVSFMGHATVDGWSFGIGTDATPYSNEGKYPFMLAGSCFVGNIHEYTPTVNNPSMAEKYVLADNKGAIGYMGTVQFGLPTYLDQFATHLYERFSNLSYNESMGYCMLKSLQQLHTSDAAAPDYKGRRITTQEYTLEGDPAVVLVSSFAQPDYILVDNATYNNVQVFAQPSNIEVTGNPGSVPAGTTSLDFVITVNNIGQAVTGNISIRIDRQLGPTSETAAQQTVVAPLGESTYTLSVPISSGDMNGTNTFTITVDANNAVTEGCENNNTASVQLTIQDCTPPTVTFAPATQYCTNTNPVTLSGTPAGGVFLLNGTELAGNSFDPDNAELGSNTLTYQYTDANNCVGQSTTNITVNEAPSTQIATTTLAICLDESVTVSPEAFSSAANYTWNFGGGTETATGGNQEYQVSWATPGTKTITLNATTGNCAASPTTIDVVVSAPLAVPAITCGNTTTNSVTFQWNAIPGATGYILNQDGTIISQAGNSYTATDLAVGETVSLSVIAQGDAPCGNSNTSLTQSCTAQNCEVITATVDNIEAIYCANEPAFTLVGSPANGSFLVDGVAATQFNPAALGAGSHTIVYQVILNGVCQYTSQTYQATIYNLPAVPTISGNAIFCQGGGTELTAEGDYETYLWNTGNTAQTISVTDGGTYSVVVSNEGGLGCSASAVLDVTELIEPNLEITAANNAIVCNGQPLTLFATAGYSSYQWEGVFSSTETATVFNAGVYTVNIVDANGCTASESITVTENTITPISLQLNGVPAPGTATLCGGSALLDAGSGYQTYLWSTGETTQTITTTTQGNYSVTVTNQNNCSDDVAILIIFGTALQPEITGDATICPGETVSLEAGDEYANYAWSNSSTTASITVSSPGTYSVTVSDAAGCTGTDSFLVIEDEAAIPTADFAIGSSGLCLGETLQLTNQSTNAGSSTWTITNTITGTIQTSSDNNPSIALTEAGVYTVTLEVQAACGNATDELSRTESVTVSDGPDITIIADFGEICPGDPVELTSQGTANLSVAWLVGTTVVGNQPTLAVTPMETTIYTLTATDAIGCLASDTAEVKVADACELPTVITPNGDGYNDTWQIPQANLLDVKIDVEIYNRWGQLVYNRQSYSNGSAFAGQNNDGGDLTHGTYYFVIRFSDATQPLSGNLTIVR